MTIVVYRDGTISSDSAAWNESYCIGSAEKCGRTEKGFLWGIAGRLSSKMPLMKWLDDPMSPPPELKETDVIVIWPDGAVRLLDDGAWMEVTAPYHTIGSGAAVALGALGMGATAQQAVALAIDHSESCAGEIQAHSLHEAVEPEVHEELAPIEPMSQTEDEADWRGGLGLK